MEFIFAKSEQIDGNSLRQGDLLEKSEELANAVKEAHSYYADADDYTHFLVLTQSCDLVKREKKPPKSPYITLAAVRPLEKALGRRVEKYVAPGVDFPIMVCARERRLLVDQFLERLLHNTEDGFFFLRAGSTPTIEQDSCVFLPLSIALRNTHYDICLKHKVAQLDDIFAAKVGWMTGNLYSRIGTPDIEDNLPNSKEYKRDFFEDVLYKKTVWLSPAQIKVLKIEIKNWKRENAHQEMTIDVARSLLDSIPDDVTLASQRAVKILTDNNIIANDDASIDSARKLLQNDTSFKKLIKSDN